MSDCNASEYDIVKSFMDDFFCAYYTERDYVKVCSHAAEHILVSGLSSQEISQDRYSFENFVRIQLGELPAPIPFEVHAYLQNNCGPHQWACCAMIRLTFTTGDWGTAHYSIRFVATVLVENNNCILQCLHVSEPVTNRNHYQNIQYQAEDDPVNPVVITRYHITQFLDQLIPGGVISRGICENYPLSMVNEQYLQMCGYSSFSEYSADHGNSFLRCIHPDDVEKYKYTVRFIQSTGKQYECEYRLRRKDGSYFWIHDIGRKAFSTDKTEIIVSVIHDMSEQVERRHQLEQENGLDFLTQIYNRKGALDRIEKEMSSYSCALLIIVDLDNFKRVNDLYGHIVGDEVLKYIAAQLQKAFAENAIVCRLGGDEFSLLVPDYSSIADIHAHLTQISQSYIAFTRSVCPLSETSISMGGVYGPGPFLIKEQLRQADRNLYRMKNEQKGSILITPYEPGSSCGIGTGRQQR